MSELDAIKKLLATSAPDLPLGAFALKLVWAAALGGALSWIYQRWGQSPSNRRAFGSNFALLSATTMLIISIVKSSLALSLGLVGALSIVRFRAAIKDPEELTFLFLAIALGLGLGADQVLITTLAFALCTVVVGVRSLIHPTEASHHAQLIVSGPGLALTQLTETLQPHSQSLTLLRFDEGPQRSEGVFAVDFETITQLEHARSALRNLDPGLHISFLET